METLSQESQSEGPDSVQPKQSQVLAYLQSAFLKTDKVGWNLILCYFIIECLKGQKNLTYWLTKISDSEEEWERLTAWPQAFIVTSPMELYDDLLQEIPQALACDKLVADINCRIVRSPMSNPPDLHWTHQPDWGSSKELNVTTRALTNTGSIYLPNDNIFRTSGRHIHNNPDSGHFGEFKVTELVSQHIELSALTATVWECIARCELPHWIMRPFQSYHAIIMLPPLLSQRWEGVAIVYRLKFT